MKELDKNAFYPCPYCGTEYSRPSDLAHCILNCEEKKKQHEIELKRAELAHIKETRKQEINLKIQEIDNLIDAYIKDYGSYCFNTKGRR